MTRPHWTSTESSHVDRQPPCFRLRFPHPCITRQRKRAPRERAHLESGCRRLHAGMLVRLIVFFLRHSLTTKLLSLCLYRCCHVMFPSAVTPPILETSIPRLRSSFTFHHPAHNFYSFDQCPAASCWICNSLSPSLPMTLGSLQ